MITTPSIIYEGQEKANLAEKYLKLAADNGHTKAQKYFEK